MFLSFEPWQQYLCMHLLFFIFSKSPFFFFNINENESLDSWSIWGIHAYILVTTCFMTIWDVLQFNALTDWVTGGTWGMIQQRSFSSLFCKRPLCAGLAWADMSTICCCPSSISSADHGVAHPPWCPEGWFWKGYRGGNQTSFCL